MNFLPRWLSLLFYRDERMGNLSVRPAVHVWRSDSNGVKHAANLLAVFARMIDDLNHQHPGLHQVSISRLELGLERFLIASCDCQQPCSAHTDRLLQVGIFHSDGATPLLHWQGQGPQITLL